MALEILSAKQMKEIEQKAYDEGASDKAFMQTVGDKIADFFMQMPAVEKIVVLVGKGNNGGDGVVVAKNLLSSTIDIVVYHLYPIEECSRLLQEHLKSFKGKLVHLKSADDLVFEKEDVILDALLGTGFSGKVTGLLEAVIKKANASRCPIYSIDIPSGVDGTSGLADTAIKANCTFCLARPKTGFFLRRGFEFVGELQLIEFGLKQKYIELAKPFVKPLCYLLTKEDLKELLPHPKRTQHKYEAGLVCALATHFEMLGASILASLAALRMGAGYLRFLYTKPLEPHLSALPVECVKMHFQKEAIQSNYEKAKAYFLGPGLPLDSKTKELIFAILKTIDLPVVIDGGALTHVSKDLSILKGKKAVLTPHHGEMEHFLKLNKELEESDLQKCQEFVNTHQITLVLKGAPTFIFHPNEAIIVSAFGDLGMATAGSGDVLTGMICGLLAQGLDPFSAAKLGVGLHGLAGEMAADDLTSSSVIASDLIQYIGEAIFILD